LVVCRLFFVGQHLWRVTSGLTNRCRQRGMAGPVPLRGSRWLVPRA
jgi:hypothetical protein